jgi:hypothetical protein
LLAKTGAVAQLVERIVRNDEVESSNLFRSTLDERRNCSGSRRFSWTGSMSLDPGMAILIDKKNSPRHEDGG